jgi:hypothetical protein
MTSYEILNRPLITEKSTIQKESTNQLTFEVDRRASALDGSLANVATGRRRLSPWPGVNMLSFSKESNLKMPKVS